MLVLTLICHILILVDGWFLGIILTQKYIISSTTLIRLAPRKSPAAPPVDTEIRSSVNFFLTE